MMMSRGARYRRNGTVAGGAAAAFAAAVAADVMTSDMMVMVRTFWLL